MKRLSIEVSDKKHHQIKAIAAIHGMTIKQYVLSRILPEKMPNQKTLKAIDDVKHKKNLKEYDSLKALLDKLKE